MSKYEAIVFSALFIAIGSILSITAYSINKKEITFAEKGLEECKVVINDSIDTIWLKDCIKYKKEIENKNKEE